MIKAAEEAPRFLTVTNSTTIKFGPFPSQIPRPEDLVRVRHNPQCRTRAAVMVADPPVWFCTTTVCFRCRSATVLASVDE
jgi:hypothetical protein